MLVNRGAVCSAPLCGSYSLGFEWQPVWPPLDEYKEVLTVSLGGTQKPTWSYDFVSGVSIQFSADDQKIFVRDMFLNQGLGSADVTIDNGSEYRVAIDVEVDALGDRNLEVYFAPKSEEFGAAKISVSLAGIATGNDQITVINRESVALVTHISTLTKVILCEGGQSSSSTSSASSDPEAPPEPIDSSSSMPMMEAPVPEEGSASSMGNPSMPESDEGASSSANSSM
jgi:hypothetical protein